MNDFVKYDKTVVRELSCRLCLCSDVIKLKPLSLELKRKLKKLFNVNVRPDDNLPKAICHECLQQIGAIHKFAVSVDKIQNYLDFHDRKTSIGDGGDKMTRNQSPKKSPVKPISPTSPPREMTKENSPDNQSATSAEPKRVLKDKVNTSKTKESNLKHTTKVIARSEHQAANVRKQKSNTDIGYKESMSLDEFLKSEGINDLLSELSSSSKTESSSGTPTEKKSKTAVETAEDHSNDPLDPIVLIDGKPAKRGPALDRQISLFYNMECYICHQTGFQYKDLMKHYKERHGVPGYVTCCGKKFHYFYPKKIIEHMAFHLQPNIFQCVSCHTNFQNSKDLQEHKSHGGKTDGKVICPRCQERFPTYRELGVHLLKHRSERPQCDYCGKWLRHARRSRVVNNMENVILCGGCVKLHKDIDRQTRARKKESDTDSELQTDSD